MKKKTAKAKPGKAEEMLNDYGERIGRRLTGPKLAQVIARCTAWCHADTLKKKAQHGKNHVLDKQVADFITDTLAGRYPITDKNNGIHPDVDHDGEQTGESEFCELWSYAPEKPFDELARQLLFPPELVPTVLNAILGGDAKKLRNLAASVERVYARAEVTGGKLTFKPAKPEKLATLANAQSSGTVRMSGKDIAAPGMSERTAQRVARLVGVKPAKPGRKKKLKLDTPAPREKPDTAAALQRDVESGAKAFWAKRKRKK